MTCLGDRPLSTARVDSRDVQSPIAPVPSKAAFKDGDFIAYVAHQFPLLRTTFLRREIEGLRAFGLPIEVVSVRPAAWRELTDEPEALAYRDTTHYLPAFPLTWKDVLANLRALVQQPGVSLGNLRLCLAYSQGGGLLCRMHFWLQIWRGAVMAARLRTLGECLHVHAATSAAAATTALVCSRLLGVPFSFTSHTAIRPAALATKIHEAAFVASISEYDKGLLTQATNGDGAPRIHVVRCGIPLDDWPYAPKRSLHQPLRILSVGGLIEKKGHEILIRTCGLLRDRGHELLCRIVGEGPLRHDLSRLIEELGLSGIVELMGPLPQYQVKHQLGWADLFALPCQRAPNGDTDGIPVVLMEAMAAGVPVASTRISGIPELVVDGETGFLAEPGNVASFAHQIERTIADSDARRRVVQDARWWIETHFNQERETAKMSYLFRRLAIGGSAALMPSAPSSPVHV